MARLVLFDSRDRMRTGKRKATVFNVTPTGWNSAWNMVVAQEVAESERDGYAFMRMQPNDHQMESVADMVDAFNEFWGEYGWFLTTWESPCSLPPLDAEITVVTDLSKAEAAEIVQGLS